MARDRGQRATRSQLAMLLVSCLAVAGMAVWVKLASSRPGSDRITAPKAARHLGLIGFDRPFPVEGRFVADPYVGSRVCAECHPGEAALYSRSGHAVTLRPAGRLEVAQRLDGTVFADPELPDIQWKYQFRDGELRIERAAPDEAQKWVADYAIGSGRHAVTFVSVLNPAVPRMLEHRLTYYRWPGGKTGLGITPGHDTHPPPSGLTTHGGELPPKVARECIRCHATQISAGDEQRFDEETMIPNVTCERCHGPGKAHVAAARRRAPDAELALPFGAGRWTASELHTMCGACHRLPSAAQAAQIRTDNNLLIRFQPVGIIQSACYKQSRGAFSCVTCHDPHARVSHDRASYDKTCLSCHGERGRPGPAAGSPPAGDRPHVAGKTCPVSPAVRCVECHMPRLDGGQGLLFSDHWIRVRRDGETPPAAVVPAPRS